MFSWRARPELLVILILYRHTLYLLYWHSFKRSKESLISSFLNPNSLLTWYNFSLSFEVKFLQPPGSCSQKFQFRPFCSFNTVQHARGGEVRKSAPCSFTRCFDFSSFSRHTGGSFYPEKRSLNTLPEMTFVSNLDKQERNEFILSCYKRKRGNELNFLIHREQREATSTGSLKKILALKSIYSFKMLIRWPFYY